MQKEVDPAESADSMDGTTDETPIRETEKAIAATAGTPAPGHLQPAHSNLIDITLNDGGESLSQAPRSTGQKRKSRPPENNESELERGSGRNQAHSSRTVPPSLVAKQADKSSESGARHQDSLRPAKRQRSKFLPESTTKQGRLPIPPNPPGRSSIALIPAAFLAGSSKLSSYFPGKLLTNDSMTFLDAVQRLHIEGTYALAQFRFEEGRLQSGELFRHLLSYTRQMLRHWHALEMSLPHALGEARDEEDVLPNFPGRPLSSGSVVPLNTEQTRHVEDVYRELIQYKADIDDDEADAYDHLLGCMEQLFHHSRALQAWVMKANWLEDDKNPDKLNG